MFDDFLDWKVAFLVFKNIDLRKSQNLHFSKEVSPWFWSKICHFFFFSIFGQIGPEKVFGDVVNRKLASQDYKKIDLRKSQKLHFPKGARPLFWSKIWNLFFSFFFGKTGREKVFGDVLERKLAFSVYKNINLKMSQNLHFLNFIVLVQNWKFFLLFVFGKIGREKVLGDVLDWIPSPPIFWGKSPGDEVEAMVLVKIWNFFFCSNLATKGSEKVFGDVLGC